MIEILSIKDEMIKFCSLSHIHLIYSSIGRLMNVLLLIARKHEFWLKTKSVFSNKCHFQKLPFFLSLFTDRRECQTRCTSWPTYYIYRDLKIPSPQRIDIQSLITILYFLLLNVKIQKQLISRKIVLHNSIKAVDSDQISDSALHAVTE